MTRLAPASWCPQRERQVFQGQTDAEGWARAVEIDKALRDENSVVTRGFRQQMYLHRSCVPLEVIDLQALPPNTLDPLTTGECHGMCGT